MPKDYSCVEVTEQTKDPSVPAHILESLARLGFGEPTEIQAAMRDPILQGKDVLALAPTGTGKTLGFGVPLILLSIFVFYGSNTFI